MSLFCEKLIYLAKGADMCIFAGSHPRGVDDNVYADLIGELKRQGVTTVIDTEGAPMDLAMRAGPDLVSPNEREAEELVGHEFRDREDHIFGLYRICEQGPREAIITHEEGCYALVGRDHERRLFEIRTERLEPVSAIGAGDAFLAGYLAARYSGRPHPDALGFAVACGAESTRHLGAGMLDPRAAERLQHEVEVTELEEPAAVDTAS
jgi:1-phosphofructokinase/tagatose 6-phosphate kinase